MTLEFPLGNTSEKFLKGLHQQKLLTTGERNLINYKTSFISSMFFSKYIYLFAIRINIDFPEYVQK